MIRVRVLQPFDAHAGAQRMAATLVRSLRGRGCEVEVRLGFGTDGFVSELGVTSRFLPTNRPSLRKLLAPAWLLVESARSLLLVPRPVIVWANTVYAAPAVVPLILFAPRRLVIHVHEAQPSAPLRLLIAWAARRGATVIAVSAHHARRLGASLRAPVTALPNAVGETDPPSAPVCRDELLYVGAASAAKGFPLFLDVVRHLEAPTLRPRAFLSGGIDGPAPDLIARAEALGIEVTVGETDPRVLYARGFLLLQLTDPRLADETFSLVTAEAIWRLIPVGGAGSAVLPEVAGAALAFNVASRDPRMIAALVKNLWADAARYDRLVAAAALQRQRYHLSRFADAALGILRNAFA